ncbi:MAG: PP2C family protein-serine/threonine phosphatase [Opitutales bacterium]
MATAPNTQKQTGEPNFPGYVAWSGLTHPGRVRKTNEDAFLALALDGREVRRLGKTGGASLAENDFIFAVSDGMGGARAGEFASSITVDRITRLLPRGFRSQAMGLSSGFNDLLDELISQIHRDLTTLGQSYEECAGMGATLSLGWLTPEWLYFAHVGDSRIYHLPEAGGIRQITHDHTHVGWLIRQGKLTEREARNHAGRHSLQQALGGSTQFIEPHIGAVGCEAGDRFLFCTDGVIEGLTDNSIFNQMEPPPAFRKDDRPVAQRVVEAAVQASGKDNTTALAIDLSGDDP